MHPVSPEVVIVGATTFFDDGLMELDPSLETDSGLHLVEKSGRSCYASEHKPNPATRANADYLANIIAQKHYSVLEHVSVSFMMTGISRNVMAEVTRHRHFSYSVLSSRYVDPFKAGLGYVVPPAMDEIDARALDNVWKDARREYYATLSMLGDRGVKGKKARETARAFLPGSLETRMVVSGNLRSYMEFVSKRDHPAADAEMQQVAHLIAVELERMYPSVFGPEAREVWDESFSQGAPKADK